MGFWEAVASAGPYANNQHLVLDRQPHQHFTTQFVYRPVLFLTQRRPNSVKALEAQ